MGKKVMKLFVVFALTIGGFFSVVGSNAEAASSNGGVIKVNGGKCEVRMYTDYYTYSKSASTVDAYATGKGTCPTLYYTMSVKYGDSGHNASSQKHTGSFSKQTPTKAFSISRIGKSEPSTTYRVWIDVYSNSAKTKWLGATDTKVIINR
ncbi:hypothetical protein [Rossellomorea marisflavi]|uniref:hypothetical protein n=1 Tax=Rossellomorea marisflavi TaxID=189381 RepID=UPI00064EC0E8|nr:hypothetical protein [Rossellomorea marisflavi]KML05222.1 hypothetical protein VL06_12960 [Rossellomorea marisflavi]MCM2606265.1 hypothetical protein [Rossellomorea marisflavi]TYO69621.1 hypothetical protein DQ398_003456 [Rossellomorea marisflavi]